MKILNELKEKVIEKIYRKMLKNLVFCYEIKKSKLGQYVYLLAILKGKPITRINMTKQVHGLAKYKCN